MPVERERLLARRTNSQRTLTMSASLKACSIPSRSSRRSPNPTLTVAEAGRNPARTATGCLADGVPPDYLDADDGRPVAPPSVMAKLTTSFPPALHRAMGTGWNPVQVNR
jgi:hypothetical protein